MALLFGHIQLPVMVTSYGGLLTTAAGVAVRLESLCCEFWAVAVLLRDPFLSLMWFYVLLLLGRVNHSEHGTLGHARVPEGQVHWGKER